MNIQRNPTRCGVRQAGVLKPVHAIVLAVLVIAAGAYLTMSRTSTTAATVAASAAPDGQRELDFGLVELIPGQPLPIPSYKNGGTMVLNAGEERRVQVMGDNPLPPIELRAGDAAQMLSGPDGKLQISGPAKQPLPALMMAQGTRHSLPGGAPPRIAVKVQVFGAARPG